MSCLPLQRCGESLADTLDFGSLTGENLRTSGRK